MATEGEKIEGAWWKELKKRGHKIEYIEEKEVFKLTQAEAAKCRYEIIDQNYRLAECITHKHIISHGVRMFPPHLWNLENGRLLRKVGKEWVPFIQKVAENKKRFD